MAQEFNAFFAPSSPTEPPVCPQGCDVCTTQVDSGILRSLKPHHSQWQEISPQHALDVPAGVPIKTFANAGKYWTEIRGNYRPRRTQQVRVFIMPPSQPGQSGGGSAAPRRITQKDWMAAMSSQRFEPEVWLSNETIEVLEEQLRKPIRIEYLGTADDNTPYTLRLKGSDGTEHEWQISGDKTISKTFNQLLVQAGWSLSVEALSKNQTVFGAHAFDTLQSVHQLSRLNDGPLLYVLDHRVENAVPVITVASQLPQFGVFFDGTGNNLANDIVDSADAKAPTNVAKLFELYPADRGGVRQRFYSEGIGTRAGEKDTYSDQGLAHSFGQRINEAVTASEEYFRRFPYAKECIIDLFGFSRGAAQARAFVNEIHHRLNANPAFLGGAPVRFRFMGLFDTVGSVGLPGDEDNNNYFSQRGMQGEINLNLNPASVENIIHFTAANEIRSNFPLSTLKSESGKLASNIEEVNLDGVHADIGGGYGPVPTTIYYPSVLINWLDEKHLAKELAKLKAEYEKKYYAPGISLKFIARSIMRQGPWKRTTYAVEWHRTIKVELAHYYLEMMHQKALQHAVPLKAITTLSSEFPHTVPDDLRYLVESAQRRGKSSRSYDALYKRYIHHSHQYRQTPPDGIAVGFVGNVNAPSSEKKRKVIPNKSHEAATIPEPAHQVRPS